MTQHSVRLAIAVAACAVLLGGCGHAVTPPATPVPLEELRTRPTLEQARDELLAATLRIQEQLSALIPGMTWYHNREPFLLNCSQRRFDSTGARRESLGNFISDTRIPDELWTEAVRRVLQITEPLGADLVTPLSDQPGDHVVEIHGAGDSINIHFATKVNTVIGPDTACHLPNAKMPKAPASTTSPTPTR